ncbi:MAG: hypothetical protein KKA80_01755, partial [Candidatus Omnitrophica bacterium]|nr:hypothetical protein [Candidatus Omnitrophota bacterium]
MKKNFRWKKTRYAALQTAGRAVLGIIICAAAISTVYIGRKPYGEGLKEGDISLRTIYAPIDFQYHVGIDKEKTKEERQKATEAVDEVYEIKTQTNQGLLEKLDKFFSRIILVQNLKEIEEEEKAERVKSGLEIDISVLDLKAFLADSKPQETRTKSKTLLKELLSKGIISESLKERIAKSGRKYVVLKIDPAQETKVSI